MSVNESTPVSGTVYPTTPTIAAPNKFGTAVGLSIAVAVLGVVVWEVLAQTAHLRSALVGFGVAAAIAGVMRAFAPNDRRAPVVIIVLTALSALAGLLASQYALVADAFHISFFTVVRDIPISKIPELMKTGTSPMTWIVMAASVYAGFAFSRRLEVQPPQPVVVAPPAPPASAPEQS
jgi:lysylphosphatidylglycerol synthetase-like protein (DUF2156 family)